MGIKSALKSVLNRCGLTVCETINLPPQVDIYHDLARFPVARPMDVIFDVGANQGVMAREFARTFPRANVYAFEPVSRTFARLVENTKGSQTIHPQQLALGDRSGMAEIAVGEWDVANSLDGRLDNGSAHRESIRITTVDEFAAKHGIDHISLLKLDVEGYELKVLEGARRMLQDAAVGMVYLEVGFHRQFWPYILFPEAFAALAPLGFRFHGLYEIIWEPQGAVKLCNALFVHEQFTDGHFIQFDVRSEARLRAGKIGPNERQYMRKDQAPGANHLEPGRGR